MSIDDLRRAGWMRNGALLAVVLLLAAIACQTLLMPSGGRSPNAIVWLVCSLPLAMFLPGLWRGGVRTYAWLSFVSLLYFAQSVTALFGPVLRAVDVLSLCASVAVFVCTLLFVRWRSRGERATAAQA
jgi:uncharacterized membrane protein